jgi:hypothetical protein
MREKIVAEEADILLADIEWHELLTYLGNKGLRGDQGQPFDTYGTKSSGVVYMHCVFHEERTPSLLMWPKSGRYRCHGCGEEGTKAEFLERLNLVEVTEDVEEVAKTLRLINPSLDQEILC